MPEYKQTNIVDKMSYKPENETTEIKAEKIEKMEEKAVILLREMEKIDKCLYSVVQALRDYVRPMLLDIAETQHMDFKGREDEGRSLMSNLFDGRPAYWDYWENGVAQDAEERKKKYKDMIDRMYGSKKK